MNSDLEDKVQSAASIQFVCSGNIIRSSFAELYARHLGMSDIASYGTTYHNSRIHPRSKQELQEMGIDPDLLSEFTPTHIDNIRSFEPSDLHVVMTQKHVDDLLSHGIPKEQIVKITAFLNRSDDVADPYFAGNYEEAYSTIRQAVDQIHRLRS